MKRCRGLLPLALVFNAVRGSGQTIQRASACLGRARDQFSSADTSERTVAWNLGAGITIGGSVTALFIETRYVHVAGGLGYSCPLPTSCPRENGPRTKFVPITAGIRFGG